MKWVKDEWKQKHVYQIWELAKQIPKTERCLKEKTRHLLTTSQNWILFLLKCLLPFTKHWNDLIKIRFNNAQEKCQDNTSKRVHC